MELDLSTIESFTDDELREKLIERGVQAGPIVASTRKFYENKLRKLLGNSNSNEEKFEEGADEDLEDSNQNNTDINSFNTMDNTHGDNIYPNVSKFKDHLSNEEKVFKLNKWSPEEMRRRPIRDFENFDYESHNLNKRFEVKPQSSEQGSYSKHQTYDIKAKPLSTSSGYGGGKSRYMDQRDGVTPEYRDSSMKKYLFYLIVAIIIVIIFFSLPSLVNWQDDDNSIPIMD